MKKKTIVSLILFVSLITEQPVSLLADEAVITNQEVECNFPDYYSHTSTDTLIRYDQASSFMVTIPKEITLNGDKTASYEVKVQGDVAGNESVTVVPDATVVLNDSNGKDSVTGTIAQTKTEFASNDVNGVDGTVTNGAITATDLTAGDWSGSFDFVITMKNTSLQAGLYDENDNLLCTWADSGIDVTKNYSNGSYETDPESPYLVFTNKYPETRKIVIPNDITYLGEGAFALCSSLSSVVIPNSIQTISPYSFYGCTSLSSVVLPDNLTSINEFAFALTSLNSIEIPNNVTQLGLYAFAGCPLESVTIPEKVTDIGESVFAACNSLTLIKVDPNNSVYDSRNNCNAIIETATNALTQGCETTEFPDTVTSIATSAFFRYSSLSSIEIPSNIMSIGASAFAYCDNLTSVTISNSVNNINNFAFLECVSLTSIILPDDISNIGECAFKDCESLSSVTYKNQIYTDQDKLILALKNNGVTIGSDILSGTKLTKSS